MKLIAFVKNKDTKGLEIIERDYRTRQAFKSDLHGNGYMIIYIHTEAEQKSWHEFYEKLGYMCNTTAQAHRWWKREYKKSK